ncbi:MAG TPA: molybdenum cofactor guanylyltransferase [Bryobacteraceae bacterium]
MRAAGYVLVGGQSSRMGRDKARLPLGSHLLVEDVAGKVAKVAGNVALIGDPALYADLPFECIRDLHPGLGPLAGIETALAAAKADLNLIVACDMPGLASEWLDQLLVAAGRSTNLCVAVKDVTGVLHPLCAVYRRECLPVVRKAVAAHRLKLLDLLSALDAEIVRIAAPLHNVNTPEEWRVWTTL